MKQVLFNLVICALLTLPAFTVTAQDTPAPSPTAEFTQKVGLTDVTIVYSRPGVKDREIFAVDGLVPYGKVWRTGANAATKLTFSAPVELGGKKLAAGSYAMLTKPGKNSWEIMLFPYESGSWNTYVSLDPAASYTAKPRMIDYFVETFLININNVRDTSATLDLLWENTLVSIPMKVYLD